MAVVRTDRFTCGVGCFFRKREHGMDRICFYPIPCLASYYRECKIYAVWNELEMASRFSLKNIVLARLTILGIFNFAIFCIIIPICHIANSISLVQTGVYLFVPYLLTTSISLYIVRHFRNKEAIYGCMAVAVCVSTANMTLRYVANFLFQTNYLVWWVVIALLLMMFTAKELYQTFKKTEGFLWNFALTD